MDQEQTKKAMGKSTTHTIFSNLEQSQNHCRYIKDRNLIQAFAAEVERRKHVHESLKAYTTFDSKRYNI